MPFVTSETVSSLAVPMLSAELSLVNTVLQVPSQDVAPPSGGETIIRVPGVRTANIQPRGGTLSHEAIVETPVPFTVDHVYDSAPLNPHELTLDIVDFMRQVIRPQVRSVAAGAEAQLADVMNGLPAEMPLTPGATDVDHTIAQAVAELDKAEVPLENRWLAVSPDFAVDLTSSDDKNLTDYQGEVGTEALRRGIVGEYRGMVVVKNPRLTGYRALAYHESAFAFGSLRPAELLGAVDGAVYTEESVQLRHVYMIDSTTATTISLVSTFTGASLVDDNRVVVIGEDAS